METYTMKAGDNAPCELWSKITLAGSTYSHKVCEGTYTYCKSVMDKLEGMK